MVGVPVTRRRAGRARERVIDAVLRYAELGWPCCLGAEPPRNQSRGCSCDRVGCPDPGAHPVSAAWQLQATADPAILTIWWRQRPSANIILPTGWVLDVLEVSGQVGASALDQMVQAGTPVGPVAAYGTDRYLFFVATRGRPGDENEWWPSSLDVTKSHDGACHVDGRPQTLVNNPDLRWHSRDSYVLAPPSLLASGAHVSWVRPPDGRPLPDPLRLLSVLAS